MILLKSLKLNNFLSHEDTTIDFEENEKLLVDGASGNGKSAIFDAIVWALYGVSRSDNRGLVRKGAKMAEVILQLKKDDEIIHITRRVTSTGKHHLIIVIEQLGGMKIPFVASGVREMQNWIDKELIGASYLLFINSVAYIQSNVESFVMQTATKRKELLLEIVKAEDYTKYYENARQALSSLGNDLNKVSWEITSLMGSMVDLQEIISTRGEQLKVITTNTVLLNELEPSIQLLEKQKEELSLASKNVADLDQTLTMAAKDMNNLAIELSKKSSKATEKGKLQELISTAPETKKALKSSTDTLTELRNNLTEASKIEEKRNEVLQRKPVIGDHNFQDVEQAKADIKRIKAEPVCPSGDKCPYSGGHEGEIKKLKARIKKIETVIKKETAALIKWTEEFNALPAAVNLGSSVIEIKDLELEVKKLESDLSNIGLIQKDIDVISEIEAEIPLIKKELDEKQKYVKKIKKSKEVAEKALRMDEILRVSTEITSKKQERDNLRHGIIRATTELENISKSEEKLKNVEAELEKKKNEITTINDKIYKVELIKQAFGSKGIETLVIDYLLPRLEEKVNDILKRFSDFTVKLDTQRKSLDGESMVEGLYIIITNEIGEDIPIENLSGGERVKVSVAITEALATLQRCGFRLFDEFATALDSNSLEGFMSSINYLQRQYPQMLMISHILDIKSMFEKQVTIKKFNGISKI